MIATLKCVLNWRLYNVLTYLLTLIGLVTSKFDLFFLKIGVPFTLAKAYHYTNFQIRRPFDATEAVA